MLNELFHLSEVALASFTIMSFGYAMYKTLELRWNKEEPQPVVEGQEQAQLEASESRIIDVVFTPVDVPPVSPVAVAIEVSYEETKTLVQAVETTVKAIDEYTVTELRKLCKGKGIIKNYSRKSKEVLYTEMIEKGLL